MRTAIVGISALVCLAATACGSEPAPERPYFKGAEPAGTSTATDPGYEPPFEAREYPAGPYGTRPGAVIENLKFSGWKKPAEVEWATEAFEPIQLADFYDPDGTKGNRYIMLNASAVWCSACRSEYTSFKNEGTYAQYRARGVEFLCVILEDNSNPPKPSKPADLQTWGKWFDVEFPMLLDPGAKMGAYYGANAFPMNMLIDAKTMTIVGEFGGNMPAMFIQLEQLLNQ